MGAKPPSVRNHGGGMRLLIDLSRSPGRRQLQQGFKFPTFSPRRRDAVCWHPRRDL